MKRIIMVLLLIAALFSGLTALGSQGLGPIIITREGEQKILFMFIALWVGIY